MPPEKVRLKVLITVKTYPIPSAKYDELVCTAGVTEQGDFIRLYPINFRELPYDLKYKKYQWIELDAERHKGDIRKESYRPLPDSIQCVGDPIRANPGNWADRSKYVLAKEAQSMEDLLDRQSEDYTSLGIFKPKAISDLTITPDNEEWKPGFINALKQSRLFETRKWTLNPPKKVSFKFQYIFECNNVRCRGHKKMIEDWEVGALYWNLVERGASPQEAAQKVKNKFFNDICGRDKDTHFFVGTVARHPKSWVILGVFYPKLDI